MAILIGDYLYSKAMSLALADKDHLVMQTVSDVTVEMAKGQVIETLKLRDFEYQRRCGHRIIALKQPHCLPPAVRLAPCWVVLPRPSGAGECFAIVWVSRFRWPTIL